MKRRTELIPKYILMVLAVIIFIMGFRHPMHVTVTEIEFDKASRAIEMSMHVFSDDLEKHLKHIEKDEHLDIIELDVSARDALFSAYFIEMVGLNVNGKEYSPIYIGHEVDGEAIWVYLEVPDIKKLKTLKVSNNTLMELFDDQANLIHFEYEGEIHSEKLDKETLAVQYDIANL